MTKEKIRLEKDWYKKSYLIFEFHRSKSNGTKRPKKWKISDTAKELGLSSGYVSESIKIVERVAANECRNRNEALRKVRS